jgi:hypothetical protein
MGWVGIASMVGGGGRAGGCLCAFVQTLRWKEIRVRREERVVCGEGEGVDDLRRLHLGFEELEEREMSVLRGI